MRMIIVRGFAAAALGAVLAIGSGTQAQAAVPANYSQSCTKSLASGAVASQGLVQKAVYGTARRSVRRTARRTSRRHAY
jgi:hypothetical protein